MNKVVLTGCNGQLGSEIQYLSGDKSDIELFSYDVESLDISDLDAIRTVLTEVRPQAVINAAAYTAVDKAEEDVEKAFLVNKSGPENLAIACSELNIRLIHISTDFVFNGEVNSPYSIDHKPDPIGVYGESKLAGDNAVRDILPEESIIIRTSWVYSSFGNNFVKTMIRLMQEKDQLGIVWDQIGSPTYARNLAEVCLTIVDNPSLSGIYHWSDLGVASWYDFAIAIQDVAVELGILSSSIPVNPIFSSEYPTPAKRPAYSVMDTKALRDELNLAGEHWRSALRNMQQELIKQ